MSWTEKYIPKSTDEILADNVIVSKIRNWAEAWKSGKPVKKCLLLYGNPGTGKTSTALAVASEYGWDVMELNASDTRNETKIMETAGNGSGYETFTESGEYLESSQGKFKLILLDEVDNISGKEDRGGYKAVRALIKKTSHPIIMTANDYYAFYKNFPDIRKYAELIEYRPVGKLQLRRVISRLCENEGINISPRAMEILLEKNSGDIRALLNDIEIISMGKKNIDADDVIVSDRDNKIKIFRALAAVFKTTKKENLMHIFDEIDEDPSYFISWIDENIPLEYDSPKELKDAYGWLSVSDIFFGRIRKRQQYSLLPYALETSVFGVNSARRAYTKKFVKYSPPKYIKDMSTSKSSRSMRKSMVKKMMIHMHTSREVIEEDVIPFLKAFKNTSILYFILSGIKLIPDEMMFINARLDRNFVPDYEMSASVSESTAIHDDVSSEEEPMDEETDSLQDTPELRKKNEVDDVENDDDDGDDKASDRSDGNASQKSLFDF